MYIQILFTIHYQLVNHYTIIIIKHLCNKFKSYKPIPYTYELVSNECKCSGN